MWHHSQQSNGIANGWHECTCACMPIQFLCLKCLHKYLVANAGSICTCNDRDKSMHLADYNWSYMKYSIKNLQSRLCPTDHFKINSTSCYQPLLQSETIPTAPILGRVPASCYRGNGPYLIVKFCSYCGNWTYRISWNIRHLRDFDSSACTNYVTSPDDFM